MAFNNCGGPSCAVVGFDPGTAKLGFAVIDIDPVTIEILNIRTELLEAKSSNICKDFASVHGEKYARLDHLEQEVLSRLIDNQARYAFCEDAYYSHLTPSAYAPLIESIDSLRRSVIEYDVFMPLTMIRSSEAKKILDIRGKGAEVKDNVRRAIYGTMELMNVFENDPLETSEHELDALLIAYAGVLRLRDTVYGLPYSRYTIITD